MPGDDVRHAAGKDAIAILVRIAQPEPGTRQSIAGKNRDHEPGQCQDLERTRQADENQIGDGREHAEAAEQPMRERGALSDSRAGVLLRQRMHERIGQRVKTISNRSEQTHVPCARPARRAPLLVPGSCQRPLKRTLR